jgi:hypothetical protein
MFGLTSQDLPDISTLGGSKPLLQRLKMAKGITMRRSTIKTKTLSENEKKEAKREYHVHYENINFCLKESYPGEQNWYVVYIRTRDSLTLSLFQLISEVRLWNNLV